MAAAASAGGSETSSVRGAAAAPAAPLAGPPAPARRRRGGGGGANEAGAQLLGRSGPHAGRGTGRCGSDRWEVPAKRTEFPAQRRAAARPSDAIGAEGF